MILSERKQRFLWRKAYIQSIGVYETPPQKSFILFFLNETELANGLLLSKWVLINKFKWPLSNRMYLIKSNAKINLLAIRDRNLMIGFLRNCF